MSASWWQQAVHLLGHNICVHRLCRQQPDGIDSSDSEGSIGAADSAAEPEEDGASHPLRAQVKMRLRLHAAKR